MWDYTSVRADSCLACLTIKYTITVQEGVEPVARLPEWGQSCRMCLYIKYTVQYRRGLNAYM
jgi:hypothetical protein